MFATVRLGIMIEKENAYMGLNTKLPECPPFVLTWVSHVWLRRASLSAPQRSLPEVTDVSVEEEMESAATRGMW